MSSDPADKRAYRLSAIDMLRGLVIVIMAIDHVRDNFLLGALQDPTVDPNVTAGVFATRWITHFCAPVFVMLAGTSAGLMAARKSRSELTRFLFTRGAWLIFVEIFIISTALSFAPGGIPEIGGQVLVVMQVIWAIGASMIALSLLQWLGRRTCFVLGLAIVAGHNLLDGFWPVSSLLDEQWPLWVSLHAQMAMRAGPFLLRLRLSVIRLDRRHVARVRRFRSIRMAAGATEPDPASRRHSHDRGISSASYVRRLWRPQSLAVAAGGAGSNCHRFPQYHQISAKPSIPADDSRTGCHALCASRTGSPAP